MRVVASTLLVVLSFLLRPLQVLLEKTKSTTSSRRRRGRRRRERRLQSGEEENNEDELLFSLSADETKWLFPHRIDPLLIEEEDLRTTVRSGRSERSCHVWFENGTRENVRMMWIDYDGNHQPYKLLKPGQRHRQQTYLTHPWTFKTVWASRGNGEDAGEEERSDGDDEEEGDGGNDDGHGGGRDERKIPVRLVINDSPLFYPPPETVDSSDEESGEDDGDMAPSSQGRAETAKVFSITYPRTITNWTPRANVTLECYHSCKAFQSAVRETLRVWTFAHAKQEEETEEQNETSEQHSPRGVARTTTLSDIPKDVVYEIIRRFAPEPPYYNLMLCT